MSIDVSGLGSGSSSPTIDPSSVDLSKYGSSSARNDAEVAQAMVNRQVTGAFSPDEAERVRELRRQGKSENEIWEIVKAVAPAAGVHRW